MLTYIVRRILLIIPTLLGITMVVFFVMKAAPGDVSEMLISPAGEMRAEERKELVEYLQKRYGLDQPAIVQYGRWLNGVSPIGFKTDEDGGVLLTRPTLKVPDLGESFVVRRPVLDMIAEALPITLLLNFVSIPVIYVIAILTGLYAARFRGGVVDVTSGVVFLALWSVPTIWAGVLLIGFLANKQYLYWFPTGGLHGLYAEQMPFLPRWTDGGFEVGYLLDVSSHLVLPVLCLSYGGFAFLSKLTRGAILESLSMDYVRTARAKGVTERDVLFRHVFRNSLLPLITVAAYILPGLLAGSVVVETIFSIDGMGRLIVESVKLKDQEVVMAATLISGVLGLVSYLIADVGYAIADPRVSYE
ncbi:MAG: ABC transporter permease [Phycisphaeraceae bacterium]